MKQLALLFLIVCIFQTSWAEKNRYKAYREDSEQRAVIRNSRALSVFYRKVSWNQDPTEIESSYLFLRDRNTGKIIELTLTETEPDSSVFNIDFPIGMIKQNQIAAELYSAPQAMLNGRNIISLMKTLIEDKSVKRKPFLLRVLRNKGQIVDVFDNKADAIAFYNKYKEQMGLATNDSESDSIIQLTNKEKPIKKKVIDTSTLQSLLLANQNDLAVTNQKNNELCEILKNIEIKRRKQVQENAKSWPTSQKSNNAKIASKKIKSGIKELKNQNFKTSVDHFFKASDLMPTKEDIYEQYGVSLFRDKKFNQSIVILELSQPSQKRQAEKDFYLSMNYFQLKDYEKAMEHFDKVMTTKDKSFGPIAAFYKGLSLIELQKFDEAKVAFQYVLDNSNASPMDKRAKKYIEYALNRKTLERKRANWLFFDGVLGLIYDSNIILAQDQARDQGTVTNEAGWRFLTQLSAKVRPYYKKSDEISVVADITNLKSVGEDFSNNTITETTDPLLYGFSVPWTHRGTFGGKAYFFDLIPGYETIIMDLDGTASATIINSIKLNFGNTLVINKNWIAKGDWFLSSNDSNILGDGEGADSIAGGLKLSSIFILNKDLERYLIPEFGYRVNDATSSIYYFTRVDLAVIYTSSIFEVLMWNNRAAYFLANYESGRVDNNYAISSGVSARISAHWNWGLIGSFIRNDSTQNPYTKHNIVTTFSFSY